MVVHTVAFAPVVQCLVGRKHPLVLTGVRVAAPAVEHVLAGLFAAAAARKAVA